MIHSENHHIRQFFPLVCKAIGKGLEALENDVKNYTASPLEIYAQSIFSRVYEIDNAFKNMSLTLEYLEKKTYPDTEFSFSEHHAFHVENFLLRLTSVVDRCYLLAGSTILMAEKKIEKLGGNKKVENQLKGFSPESAKILKKMNDEIDVLKKSRNKVAHQAGFSSKNLCVVQAIENSESEAQVESITDIMSLEEIKDVVIKDSIYQFQKVSSAMDQLVTDLIESLSFVYNGLLERT
ncbi:Cthe_2314 family HEPN domain-containing protein [Aliivibrio logei]|uniref:Cthe-2314-like HEPN domain-containing protein n=1 Tax=Aliivibrio logei TaxID=688 RepID=A0A1B9NW56_ALILO|nr:Cthe_2314 family HEPN domain-containing protein [Aliivibrio logei]OCH19261.1 hypothetical protein A6E04_16845 [Aliivibrio logei]